MQHMTADNLDLTTMQALADAHTDITGAEVVDVSTSADDSVLWVNVNGICVLRICRIKLLIVQGQEA